MPREARAANDWIWLGGPSLLLWAALALIALFSGQSQPAIARHLGNLPALFATGVLLVSTPHFLWTYRRAYLGHGEIVGKTSNGLATRLRSRWPELVVAPILLLTLLALALHGQGWSLSTPGLLRELALALDRGCWRLGIPTRVAQYPNLGALLIGALFVAQYTLLGWHYTRQVRRVVTWEAAKAEFPLRRRRRELIRLLLIAAWISYVCEVNAGYRSYNFGAFQYFNLAWPWSFVTISRAFLGLATLTSVWEFFVSPQARSTGRPPIGVWLPIASLLVWFVPPFYQSAPGYWDFLVPLAHAVQYLGFDRSQAANRPRASLGPLTWFGLVAAGFVALETLPEILDRGAIAPRVGFFAAASFLLLNLHHYALDRVIEQDFHASLGKADPA